MHWVLFFLDVIVFLMWYTRTQVTKYLIEIYVLVPKTCDLATVIEFNNFIDNETKKQQTKSFRTEIKNKRLDHFYFKETQIMKYKQVSLILKLILTMSHGQVAF